MYAKCEEYHVPVLLSEAVDGLDIKPEGIYVDLTFGGGGHSREILRRLNGTGHLYSFDQDEDAMENAKALEGESNFTFIRSNFRFLKNWMLYSGHDGVDGILADLGVSSHHLDEEERGFSFRFDAPLDMRMNRKASLDARKIVEEYSEEQLSDILYLYGELKNSRRIAAAIVKARQQKPITTTTELVEVLKPLMARDSWSSKGDREKLGTRLPGAPHRGQRRDGCPASDAERSNRGPQARRTTERPHLPFPRGPHGKEHRQGRQRRRKSRD